MSSCKKSQPDTSNICNDSVGQSYESRGFCAFTTDLNQRKHYCEALSDGEWEYAGAGEKCCYLDTNNRVGCGCITAKLGQATKCRRKEFKGDTLSCCLRDNVCSADKYITCFQDNNLNRTCAPEHRNISSSSCNERMLDYCTGTDIPGDFSWIQRWIGDVTVNGIVHNKPCYNLLYRNLYDGQYGGCTNQPLNQGIINSIGYNYDQNLMNAMITKYINEGGDLSSLESSETRSDIQLNSMIWEVCKKTPGICQKALFNYCANVTPETIVRNSQLLPWCGCYMNPEEYQKYTDLYQISRECAPPCNMQGVINLPSDNGAGLKICKKSTCIIDDITINIANSQVGDGSGITFSQLCNSCSSIDASCNCLVSNGNFDFINSKIGDVTISQQCGGSSVCYKEVKDDLGNIKTVKIPCVGDNKYENIEQQNKENYEKNVLITNIIIISIFIFLILIIIIVWYALFTTKTILHFE